MSTQQAAPKLKPVALAIFKNDTREIEICLNNGIRVKVYGSNAGYVQYMEDAHRVAAELTSSQIYQTTQPIAQRWAKWLNGGSPSTAPQPSKRYTEYQDLAAYERATAKY